MRIVPIFTKRLFFLFSDVENHLIRKTKASSEAGPKEKIKTDARPVNKAPICSDRFKNMSGT